MNSQPHNCIGSSCAICHPRCECHECTQARAKEHDTFYGYSPLNPLLGNEISGTCPLPCCQPGYVGDCFCNHRRSQIS